MATFIPTAKNISYTIVRKGDKEIMGILEIYFISLSFLSPYPLYLHTIFLFTFFTLYLHPFIKSDLSL
ncbi:MAG: hypothetical protein QME07_02760 [bacterium]|nr:hypothetical protein [bacterium]